MVFPFVDDFSLSVVLDHRLLGSPPQVGVPTSGRLLPGLVMLNVTS
jgi:hypothetical protein